MEFGQNFLCKMERKLKTGSKEFPLTSNQLDLRLSSDILEI
jgi:hypothetical protein